MKYKINSNVLNLFYAYIIIFYVIPFIGLFFFKEKYQEIFNIKESLNYLFVVPSSLFLVFFINSLFPKIIIKSKILQYLSKFWFNNKVVYFLTIIFLLFSIVFFREYSISFRHKQSISEGGPIIIILFGLRAYFKSYLFFCFILKFKKIENNINFIVFFIVFISYILSLNSSFDIVFAFVSFSFIFSNKFYFDDIYKTSQNSLGSFMFKITAVFFLIIMVVFVGIANKIGTEETFSLFSNIQLIKELIIRIIVRLSTHFNSIITSGEYYFKQNGEIMELFQSQIINLKSRLYILFGQNALEKPAVWSINRLNYINLFYDSENERTGASPGLFASIFYIPNLVFSILIISMYIFFLLRSLTDVLSSKKYRLKQFGYFILLFFWIPFVESPLDYINFLSPGFIYFFSFLIIVNYDYHESN
jgi:hypothetical protein